MNPRRHIWKCVLFSALALAVTACGCGWSGNTAQSLPAGLNEDSIAAELAGEWTCTAINNPASNGEMNETELDITFVLEPTRLSHGEFRRKNGSGGAWDVLETRREFDGTYSGRMRIIDQRSEPLVNIANAVTDGTWEFIGFDGQRFARNHPLGVHIYTRTGANNHDDGRPRRAGHKGNSGASADIEQLLDGLALLSAPYRDDGLFASNHIADIKNDEFDFAAAKASSLTFNLYKSQYTATPGWLPSQLITKELEVFKNHGFIHYAGTIEPTQPIQVVASSSPELSAIALNVKVTLGDVLDAVPTEHNGAFITWLISMMNGSEFEYRARIDVANEHGALVIKSHGFEGEQLSPDTLKRIIRQNVSTLASVKMIGLIQPAFAKAIAGVLPNEQREDEHRFAAARRHEPRGARAPANAKSDREIASNGEREFQAKVESLLANLPREFSQRYIIAAPSVEIAHRLVTQSRAIDLMAAIERSWLAYACRTRCRKNYSVKALAKETAKHISELGVGSFRVDLSAEPRLIFSPFDPKRGSDVYEIYIFTTFTVHEFNTIVPFVPPSWLTEEAWGGVTQRGMIEINIPIMGGPNGGIVCDAGAVALEGSEPPQSVWVAAEDFLNEDTLGWLISSRVGILLARECEARMQDVLLADADSRITKNGRLYGSEMCLPEAAVQEDGIDLTVLEAIRKRIEADEYWGNEYPASTGESLAQANEQLTKLALLRKPRTWKNTKGGEAVVRPRFLDASVVVLERPVDPELEGERNLSDGAALRPAARIPRGRRDFLLEMRSDLREERKHIDVAGRRSLDRMQQLARSAVESINRGGVQAVGGDVFADDFDIKSLYVFSKATAERDETAFAESEKIFRELAMISVTDDRNAAAIRSLSASVLRPVIRERVFWLLERDEVQAAFDLLGTLRDFDPKLDACMEKISQAWILLAAGQTETAEALAHDAYASAAKARDVCRMAESARVLATVFIDNGRPEDALTALSETLNFETTDKILVRYPEDFGRTLDAFGRAALASGKLELAKEALTRARLCYALSLPTTSPELTRVDDLLRQLPQPSDADVSN